MPIKPSDTRPDAPSAGAKQLKSSAEDISKKFGTEILDVQFGSSESTMSRYQAPERQEQDTPQAGSTGTKEE